MLHESFLPAILRMVIPYIRTTTTMYVAYGCEICYPPSGDYRLSVQ